MQGARCTLHATRYTLQATSHKPQATSHKPQATSHKPQATSHKPQATSHSRQSTVDSRQVHGSTGPRVHGSTSPRVHESTSPRVHKSTSPQRTTQNVQPKRTTQNVQPTTYNLQSAICNLQSAICNLQSAICNLQSAICNLQSAICNLQSAICNLQSAICNLQSAICNLQSAICNLQSTIHNPQSTIHNPQSTIHNPQSTVLESSSPRVAGSRHRIFRCTSALERGQSRSKEAGKTSIHFNGSTENIELLLQMVISVNQLSLYGAVADMIAEVPVGRRALEKPVASGQPEKRKILTQPPLAELQATEERQGNLLQECEQRFEKLSEDQKLSRLCSEAGWRLVEVGQANQSLCREYTMPRDQKRNSYKRMDPKQCAIWPVSDKKVCNKYGRYSIEVQVQSLFKDQTESWI